MTCRSSIFIHPFRITVCAVFEQVSKARAYGVNSIVLFPKVPDGLKVLTLLLYVNLIFYRIT